MASIHHGSLLTELQESERASDRRWEYRYRPANLADMALDPTLRRQCEVYVRTGQIPHLVLTGEPGVGKTTLAEIIVRELFPTVDTHHVLRIDASQSRTIDTIREVVQWIEAGGGVFRVLEAGWKCAVVVDEADGLTAEAQAALKNPMERYAARSVFIFTTNDATKINAAVRSRCEVVEMEPPPVVERARVLADVLQRERVVSTDGEISEFVKNHGDMRSLLRTAQKRVDMYGTLRAADCARQALVHGLSVEADDGRVHDDGLLSAILDIFEMEGVNQLPTNTLLERIAPSQKGALTAPALARILAPFEVKPRAFWISTAGGPKRTVRGYLRSDIEAATGRQT